VIENWILLLWLAAALALLLSTERWIHRHLQGVMLLFTGDPEIAVALYALPLLPGILLHELSHALAAILVGVRVRGISIRPKRAGQRVQLGFVPVDKTDFVRASLIGLAPLLAGSSVVLLIGYHVFDIGTIDVASTTLDWANLAERLRRFAVLLWEAFQASDAWTWAYIVFAVSNTMLPSRSDRQAWPPIILFLLLIGALVWLAGLGPAIVDGLTKPLSVALQWLGTICALTITVDLPFVLLITLAERLLERVKDLQVEY
jgi:hypothetical protein